MKNIALTLFILLLVSACSSGSTVAEIPFNVTGLYTGTFENTAGTEDGNVTLNIAENDNGSISGNIIFESRGRNCLVNGSVSGSTSSFSVAITVDQSSSVSVTTTETDDDGVETTTTETTDLSGGIDYLLTQGNNGSSLSGTYVTSGDFCSNSTGSGTIQLSR